MRDKLRKKRTRPTKNTSSRRHYIVNHYEWMIVWTSMWLIFISVLCIAFDSALPLWLLIIWVFGI